MNNSFKNEVIITQIKDNHFKINKGDKSSYSFKANDMNLITKIYFKCCKFYLNLRKNKNLFHETYIKEENSSQNTSIKEKLFKNKKIFLIFLLILLIFISTIFVISFHKTIIIKNIINKIKKLNIYRLLDDSNNKYNAYTNAKKDNYCQYLVDGKDYYFDLFQQLMEARESIYITGFWLSPELFLIRPVDENIYLEMEKKNLITKDLGKNISRLMDILNYKAKQNVKIYILIFYEWSISMDINSKHTENTFKKLNKNINIIRFPIKDDNYLWTNHEKLVIIDKIIGYVGGFDLCWGRYDNNSHPIAEKPNKNRIYYFPFKDYINSRIFPFKDINYYTKESVPRYNNTRLPWHDVHSRIIGPAVMDITSHFIERWNFALTSKLKESGFNIKNIADYKNEKSIWTTIKNYFTSNENINDKQAENFIQIEEAKNQKLEKEIYKKYQKLGVSKSDVQVLRSVSNWNTGIKQTEASILKAYYDLIQNAEHYIFIENQFFISKPWADEENKDFKKNKIKNEIALYIRKRIERAYENNENFKAYIIINLLPDFYGEVEDSSTVRIILKNTYSTISRNNGLSLIEQLEKKMGDKWKNYLGFYSLRTHGLVNNIPKTEIIYIHSKLLIVDDRKVIIGSANLNDRSMIGTRDSEFAVLIEEEKEDYFLMNGNNEYQAAKFAVGLRKKLMAEYLGIDIDNSILDDPVSNDLFNFMNSRARRNTQIYHDLFSCYPDDAYTNYKLLEEARKNKENELPEILLNKYLRNKNKIIGFIVEFPLYFLKDENLGKITHKMYAEDLLPEISFI